jgi:hypothetical protein
MTTLASLYNTITETLSEGLFYKFTVTDVGSSFLNTTCVLVLATKLPQTFKTGSPLTDSAIFTTPLTLCMLLQFLR